MTHATAQRSRERSAPAHHAARSVRRALWIALALALLTGCPERHQRPDDLTDDPTPWLTAIAARDGAIERLTAELKLEVWRGRERVRLRQLIAVARPNRLRIDSLSPFEQPLSTLVSDGSILAIYDLENKRFLQGRASAANLARLMPVPLEPGELSTLLRGGLPLVKHQTANVDWDTERGWVVLRLEGGERRQRVSLDPRTRQVQETRVWRGERVEWSILLADYASADPRSIPRRLRIEVPGEKLRVEVVVADHELDPELPEEAFMLEPPRGIAVERMETFE